MDNFKAMEQSRDEFRNKFHTEVSAHAVTKGKLAILQAKDMSVSTRAAEQLAKNGIAPVEHDYPKNLQSDNSDGADLYRQYEQLMATDSSKASAFFDKHEKVMLAWASK